jgi:PIN domain nuclease of toxin-antitoxin system
MSGYTATEAERPGCVLLDTHVFVWHMEGSKKIGKWARAAVEEAAESDAALVSAITPWEIALLVSKGRLKLGTDVMDWLRDALANPGLQVAPLEPEIAVASTRLPFDIHADPAGRILVATARHLGATIVTADRALLDLSRSGYFRAINAER